MMNIPFTQLDVLSKVVRHTRKGLLWCPKGADYKRTKALNRRGLVRPVHGRAGEGIEQFVATDAGLAMYPDRRGATL